MTHLTRSDLMSLETYSAERTAFRARVLAHKKARQVAIGPNAMLYFEDRLTVQYQIQEMLRIERIFEADAIDEELAAYNPLIPDGRNLKATFMIEFAEVDERRAALARMAGVEHALWLQVDGHQRVLAVADEDLDRSTADKTSAVHFVRFELADAMVEAWRGGAAVAMGTEHAAYRHECRPLAAASASALLADLD